MPLKLTVSIDYVSYPNNAVKTEVGLVEAADEVLYLAEHNGRNLPAA